MRNRIYIPVIFILVLLLSKCSTTFGRVMSVQESDFFIEKPLLQAVDSEMAAEITNENLEGTASETHILFLTFGEDEKTAAYKALQGKKADGIYVVRKTTETTGVFPFYWKNTYKIRGKAVVYKFIGIKAPERAYMFDQFSFKIKQRDNLKSILNNLRTVGSVKDSDSDKSNTKLLVKNDDCKIRTWEVLILLPALFKTLTCD